MRLLVLAVTGLATALYRIRTRRAIGVMVAGWIKAESAKGLTVAGYNQIHGRQNGLAIGLFNDAYELNGVQIGVLNRPATTSRRSGGSRS